MHSQLQRLVKRLAILAGGMIGALALSDAAQALTDTIYRYSTPRTGFYTVDHRAMGPDDSGRQYITTWGDGLKPAGGTSGCFSSGVNLPHGATVVHVTVFYTNGLNSQPSFYLFRHKLSDGTDENVAFGLIVEQSGKRKSATFAADQAVAVIDNRARSYAFGACLGANTTFHSARIHYTYETAGD